MRGVSDLLSFDEALERILERVQPLPAEQVALEAAAGRVLAEPARAHVDLPPFPSSAMDGFAVRAADTPGRLPVVFRIAAGRPASRPLGVGEAMAIATGGVVPEEADAVTVFVEEEKVAQKVIEAAGGEVLELAAQERQAFIRAVKPVGAQRDCCGPACCN